MQFPPSQFGNANALRQADAMAVVNLMQGVAAMTAAGLARNPAWIWLGQQIGDCPRLPNAADLQPSRAEYGKGASLKHRPSSVPCHLDLVS